jgi:muramoyltetrapeptide carboxypeptidase
MHMRGEEHPKLIRVVAPAGPVAEDDLDRGMQVLRDRGFTVEEAPHARAREGYLAGRDEDRLEDLQSALDDPLVDVVWFARGGYGTTRLLPKLSADGLTAHPKVLAGFSDATALFAWAQGIRGVRRLYAPSAQELGREGVCALDDLWKSLDGSPCTLPGKGPKGPLGPFSVEGGCLTLCSVLAGTSFAPDLEGRWLFLEDVGEPMYRIDRMVTHLDQAGWLRGAEGLLLGGFTGMGEGEGPDQVVARLRELVGGQKPIISGLPAGHLKGKRVLPLGEAAHWDGRILTAGLVPP